MNQEGSTARLGSLGSSRWEEVKTDTARTVRTPLGIPTLHRAESWELQAHCRGPMAWWWDDRIDEGETPAERRARHRKARAVCATCPAFQACAAAVTEDDSGIRAGRLVNPERQLISPGQPCLRCEAPMMPGRHHKPRPEGWKWAGAHGYCIACAKVFYASLARTA